MCCRGCCCADVCRGSRASGGTGAQCRRLRKRFRNNRYLRGIFLRRRHCQHWRQWCFRIDRTHRSICSARRKCYHHSSSNNSISSSRFTIFQNTTTAISQTKLQLVSRQDLHSLPQSGRGGSTLSQQEVRRKSVQLDVHSRLGNVWSGRARGVQATGQHDRGKHR